ncbi:MAG: hypothetical protein LBU64_08500 [Planctomycetota bacterium]|jgi:hypothetical protein|nr:hypothetical protein [Planctomycetota bacterium]
MRRSGGRGERAFQAWPGLLAPLGLTFLFGFSVWLFVAKVEADRRAADRAVLELEKNARLGAKDILVRAVGQAKDLLGARLAAREAREKDLRLEAKSVLAAIHGRLTAVLGDPRLNRRFRRREVGRFPSGFEGLRSYLEIPPPDEGDDDAILAALRSASPELAVLLPVGASLEVIEDNSREALRLGGGSRSGEMVTATLIRDLVLDHGGPARFYSLKLELAVPDENPPPDAALAAARLSRAFSGFKLEGADWGGWLLGADGAVAASFPAREGDDPSRLYTGKYNEWTEAGNGQLVWMEMGEENSGIPWRIAVAAAVDRPAPPLDPLEEFWRDQRWSLTLSALLLFSLVGWIWFFRSWASASLPPRAPAENSEAAAPPPGVRGPARNPEFPPGLPEGRGAGADERMTGMPSGSLFRLQGIHRGRETAEGSRALDRAGSQVLRELAARVRPGPASLSGREDKIPLGVVKEF